MNLTWHIARNDIVRLRYHLIPWLGVVALQVFLNWRLLAPVSLDFVAFDRICMFANLAGALGLLLTFFLAAAVLLEDPVSDSSAFWVTRPILGGQLLRAKLVATLFLLLVPPLLLWLPWWLYCGYPFSDLVRESVRTMTWQGAAIFPAFVLSSQTGRVGRLALVSAAVVAAILVVLLIATAYQFPRGVSHDLLSSRLLLALLIMLVFGAVSVGCRYVSSGTGKSSITLGTGILLIALVMAASPWNLVGNWRSWQWRSTGDQGIKARIVSAVDARRTNEDNREKFLIDVQIALTGVPDDLDVDSGWADIEVRWPDGMILTQRQRSIWSMHNRVPLRLALGLPRTDSWKESWDTETDRWLQDQKPADRQSRFRFLAQEVHAHGNSMHLTAGAERGDKVWTTLEVDRAEIERISSETPEWRVVVRGVLAKPTIILDQPLVAGASQSGEGVRAYVAGLGSSAMQKPYRVKFTSGGVLAGAATRFGNVDLCWVDPERKLAWDLGPGWRSSLVPFSTQVGVLNFYRWTPQLMRNGAWIDEDESQQKPRLVALSYRPISKFECVAEISHLKFGPVEEP